MNATIFLVPEDIVDVRPRLVRYTRFSAVCSCSRSFFSSDHDVRWEFDEHPEQLNVSDRFSMNRRDGRTSWIIVITFWNER